MKLAQRNQVADPLCSFIADFHAGSDTEPVKILHLILDEKFIDFVSGLFSENAGAENRFVLQSSDLSVPLKHVLKTSLWRQVDRSYNRSEEAGHDLNWCDCLLIHFMTGDCIRLMQRIPAHVKVLWSGWGGDYYHFLCDENMLYEPMTQALVAGIKSAQQAKTVSPKEMSKAAAVQEQFRREVLLPSLGRVDYFSAPIREDYESLRAALGARFTAEFIQLNYASIDHTFQNADAAFSGQNILVGNSATSTNNHLEVFKILARLDLGTRKVVVPLSYGSPEYREIIQAKGRDWLGDHFMPLVDFLPLDEYNLLTSSCSIAIMNHVRQQALGNIGFMLHQGARVVLNARGATYRYFRRMGIHIQSIEEIESDPSLISTPLSAQQAADNRKILEEIWSYDVVRANTQHIIHEVGAHKGSDA